MERVNGGGKGSADCREIISTSTYSMYMYPISLRQREWKDVIKMFIT